MRAGEWAGTRVLVTGASGFIGSALTRQLVERGAAVHALSRSVAAGEAEGVRWWQGDLAADDTAEALVTAVQPEVVFHLASYVAGGRQLPLVQTTLRSNLVSTVNLMSSLAEHGCRSLVIAGSMEEPLHDGDPPGSPYAAAKWASSVYARMFFALYGLPVVTARIFMTYGPAQPDRKKLVPYVTECLLRGEAPELASGERLVDWVYVDDVVEGLLAAALTPEAAGQTVDLGSGALVSIRGVVEHLVRCANPGVEPRFGALANRPLEHSRVADVEASHALLGWRPVVSLEAGLAQTVEWHRQQQQHPAALQGLPPTTS